ncbi:MULTISPECIES: indole-3-glycerol phosphate synthase TrpC [unclassified Paenibacillus]|uniref:indole-3-glycerol phosphate synthase TrpC n=1 Tax=unclassified Paenibacillus TaxID=185978 RepID=UPI002404D8D2|nr:MULTISPECIES: indole-3-glycerol phosphate synthase TrpC [unclassified Paenibacillus]MDF9840313.1 indole-3-glycerol phosphate synthase [Paenibacillus sp. PastF-2]MDF9846895.1 indole-3-glycerol phosphate synthase [Paenibacillus sp. PastM-2]MDF9853467.1 indole-3-glycerol phosphate synthase [Paenibacillus sp. PastF-1]MDH6479046.1 indole-3-glycerol phosphate synthase [Paenibacillus sp. PastH-2]MDH6506778.1 indole-3-glycerol phosphate synthase [Paenibacillus sp. PastM-3]
MYLDKIVATKVKEVAALGTSFSIAVAEEVIAGLPATRGFRDALIQRRNREMGLIAEVKKASPSKGLIRADFDPSAIARGYEAGGADCLSVLTDRDYFQGSNAFLQQVRDAVSLPLLRKDFIIDELQIYEARILGADAILLIAAILTAEQLASFTDLAGSLGLDVLIEIHDQSELELVISTGKINSPHVLLGINNRNLRTFETRLETTAELAALVPQGVAVISESGIAGPADIDYLRSSGADGVLVGEYLMRQENVEEAVHGLLGPVSAGKDRALHG